MNETGRNVQEGTKEKQKVKNKKSNSFVVGGEKRKKSMWISEREREREREGEFWEAAAATTTAAAATELKYDVGNCGCRWFILNSWNVCIHSKGPGDTRQLVVVVVVVVTLEMVLAL